ncbi:hypothetical protein BS50DRAFT_586667 [Corynespora cassiicola Philippines]|uniref:Uncharacterized protein n=1 Tax=Corynespora cassiicola Philippines TaxID=1448308 RepID=A0A2T2NVC9_CORCC|nr:hypothetical protein BS50DRAFT_586667 [Corynespora cassiicola Philippines]
MPYTPETTEFKVQVKLGAAVRTLIISISVIAAVVIPMLLLCCYYSIINRKERQFKKREDEESQTEFRFELHAEHKIPPHLDGNPIYEMAQHGAPKADGRCIHEIHDPSLCEAGSIGICEMDTQSKGSLPNCPEIDSREWFELGSNVGTEDEKKIKKIREKPRARPPLSSGWLSNRAYRTKSRNSRNSVFDEYFIATNLRQNTCINTGSFRN